MLGEVAVLADLAVGPVDFACPYFGPEFVVAAPQVLHGGLPGGDDPQRAVSFESAMSLRDARRGGVPPPNARSGPARTRRSRRGNRKGVVEKAMVLAWRRCPSGLVSMSAPWAAISWRTPRTSRRLLTRPRLYVCQLRKLGYSEGGAGWERDGGAAGRAPDGARRVVRDDGHVIALIEYEATGATT